jgi:hypothetical protein
MGIITLYEGNNATQTIVTSYEDNSYSGQVKPNDEARSLKLNDVRVGCKITIYDDRNANTSDDYCIIEVKKQVHEYIVGSFEKSIDDDTVKVTFVRNNGLDGKVSYIKIQ